MNKKELVSEVAARTRSSIKDTQGFLNALQEVMTETLAQGEDVKLLGFGSICPRKQAIRKVRNPHTGGSMILPERISVKFKTGQHLHEKLNAKK